METMGASFDAEWESICKLFSVEESDSCAHLLDYSPPASVQDDNLTSVAPSSSSYLSNRSFFGNFSEENYLNGNVSADNCLFGVPCYNDLPVLNDVSLGMLFAEDARNEAASTDEGSSTPQKDNAFHDIHSASQSCCTAELSRKRKLDDPVTQDQVEEKTSSMGTPKKKARISKTAQKVKKKGQPKKDEVTPTVNGGEEAADVANDNSEDESNVSEETNEVSESTQTTGLTSTGKKRASRGAATDPQSLYARRRRMRINERLRILQNLVPNGTKVDISTMLDEAFHYVKFLQLQIRLLSSDDLWMFAPLAYNGFDVGAYRKMSPFLGI